MKKTGFLFLTLAVSVTLAACTGQPGKRRGEEEGRDGSSESGVLVYGSGDYTRINPAMDEHCEINALLFNGQIGRASCRERV